MPLVPLFKVCDIRRNLSDKWKKSYTQSAYVIADCSKPSERSSHEGLEEVNAGKCIPGEEVFARLREKYNTAINENTDTKN